MSVVDLQERIRQKQARERRPDRDPDFELHGWLEGSQVTWSFYGHRDEVSEILSDASKQQAACHDAAWNIARASEERGDRPALWFFLDNDGHHILVWDLELVTGTSWRHGWWLCRQWWRLSLRWWRLIYRAARGRG